MTATVHDERVATTRRVRALARIGLTRELIAHHAGHPVTPQAVRRALAGHPVPTLTAKALAVLYAGWDEGTRGIPSPHQARSAATRGWAPPSAWDDTPNPDGRTALIGNPRAVPHPAYGYRHSRAVWHEDPVITDRCLGGDRALFATLPEAGRDVGAVYRAAAARGITAPQLAELLGNNLKACSQALCRVRRTMHNPPPMANRPGGDGITELCTPHRARRHAADHPTGVTP